MSPKSGNRWHVKLGALQILVLLGVVTGSMLGAFGIGYVSGNTVGFESAQGANVTTLARFPVERTEEESDYVSEVYAKLNDKKPAPKKKKELKRKEPTLKEKIPENVPIMDEDSTDAMLDELADLDESPSDEAVEFAKSIADNKKDNSLGAALKSKKAESSGLDVALVGGSDSKKDAPTTLGMLLEERKREREAMKQEEAKTEEVEEKTRSLKQEPKQIENKPEVSQKAEVITSSEDINSSESKEPSDQVLEEKKLKAEESKPTKEDKTEEKPKVEKQQVSTPDKISPGWYAQVLAPKDLDEARAMSEKLKDSGFPVVIEQAEVRGQKYFRVLVGGEETRKQAEILIKQLEREKYLRGDPFLRLLR